MTLFSFSIVGTYVFSFHTCHFHQKGLGHPEFCDDTALSPSRGRAVLEKGPVMKNMKNLIKTNTVLTHIDLSYNNFRQDACRLLGSWLRSNHSLFGLHLTGNACFVDARGFVRVRHGANQYAYPDTPSTAPASIVDFPDRTSYDCSLAHFGRRHPCASGSGIASGDGRCWVCGRWVEMQITFELDKAELPPPTTISSSKFGRGRSNRRRSSKVSSSSSAGSRRSRNSSRSSFSQRSSINGERGYDEVRSKDDTYCMHLFLCKQLYLYGVKSRNQCR